MRKWWTYHQLLGKNMGWSRLSYKEANEWEGPFLYHSSHRRHLSASSASHTQRTQGPWDEFQWHITMHTSFRAICCFPRVPPTPTFTDTPKHCIGCNLSPKCIIGMAIAHTAPRKGSACPEKNTKFGVNQNCSWQRLDSRMEKNAHIPPKSTAMKNGIFLTGHFSKH